MIDDKVLGLFEVKEGSIEARCALQTALIRAGMERVNQELAAYGVTLSSTDYYNAIYEPSGHAEQFAKYYEQLSQIGGVYVLVAR